MAIDPVDLEMIINPRRERLSPEVRAERTADAEAAMSVSLREDAARPARSQPTGPPPGAYGTTSGLELNAFGELVRPDGSVVDEEPGARPASVPRTETSQRRGIDRRLHGSGITETGSGSIFDNLRSGPE